jgi:hypothetical protein
MRQLWKTFALKRETFVLDVGGSEFNWKLLPVLPRILLLNVAEPAVKNANFTYVVADGRHVPFKDRGFDLVYSNSVLEHVGGPEDQRLFAMECRRVGRRYYVQTPNRRFFIEPHLITPLLHWLPFRTQRIFLRNFTLWGLVTRPTKKECDDLLNDTRLLVENELQNLFPDAEIWHERFLGMTKSLIAAKVH